MSILDYELFNFQIWLDFGFFLIFAALVCDDANATMA